MPSECGKDSFSRKQAEREAKRRARDLGGELRPYQCRWCDAWHLSSTSSRQYATRQRMRYFYPKRPGIAALAPAIGWAPERVADAMWGTVE